MDREVANQNDPPNGKRAAQNFDILGEKIYSKKTPKFEGCVLHLTK